VERGADAGRIGYVSEASLTVAADPTSQRTPLAGPAEDAYAQLQTELGNAAPNRNTIFSIMGLRMTADQFERLGQAGNPEFARLQALRIITARDMLRITGLIGLPLHRRLQEYLRKRGRSVPELRQAFATANHDERLEVARDDAMVGRLRRILGGTHPEIIFGTILARLYPADGEVRTLAGTNPELARWLGRHTGRGADLTAENISRATGLQNALITMNNQGPGPARTAVRAAVNAAPRGAALPVPERNALDEIEEQAYSAAEYTSRDLAAMFITRWGRPFRGAASRPKTFLHRLWGALAQMPQDQTLLTNTLERIGENTDPNAAGSFTDWLGGRDFGTIVADRPNAMEPVHADGAQNSRTITVSEPWVDLYRRNLRLQVTQADGTQVQVQVRGVNARRRRITLSQRVNVADNAEFDPSVSYNARWADYARGEALHVTAAAALFADNAGAPDTGNQVGMMQPGYTVAELARQNVGGTDYVSVRVYEGRLRGQTGWVEASKVSSLGGQTVAQVDFDHTMRHEMGHALDTQLNGFSVFSAPSKADWRKYTSSTDWVSDLINTGGIASPDTNVVHNGVNTNFRNAATIYTRAVQADNTGSAPALRARQWLQGWVAAGGSQAVYDVITQFNANSTYYNTNGVGLPAIGGRVFGAHYSEWFSADDAARQDSLNVGISPYAYTCSYEFFADHYAAYTGPGVPPERYARAVPGWARNFFDRLVGQADAGPRVGAARRRMP
jgi:hypothetical protein